MNKKRLMAQFCIFLIVMLPICFADDFEQEGESLIIEAKQYEPEVLRSDYMEQLNIPVRVILGAIRGTPISVPEIKTVHVEIIKKKEVAELKQEEQKSKSEGNETEESEGKKAPQITGTSEEVIKDYVQGTPKFYKAPYPTLDNLGFVQITLKKIPQEHKVPKQIDLDFKATITYEAERAAFTIGGEDTKILEQGTVEMVKDNKQKYSILGGDYYLRVVSIKGDTAAIEVLDQEFKRAGRTELEEGEISKSIKLSKEQEPKSIRLKLESIRGAGIISLKFTDEEKAKSFDEGKDIGGGWETYRYFEGDKDKEGDEYIRLRNDEYKSRVVLTVEKEYDAVDEIKTIIEACVEAGKDKCKVYKDSKIKRLKKPAYPTEDFLQAVGSLENLGLEKLESIKPKKEDRYALFETSETATGKEDNFNEGDPIGDEECGCEIKTIGREYVWVEDIKKCDEEATFNSKRLKVGEYYEGCGGIELKGITRNQQAVITVLPGTGEGKTTTYFSVHIPVEERAIQYTPEELQEKINKTMLTIAKLDNTINQLQKLVEGWTKICLITMAAFTVMSFFQGMSKDDKKEKDKTKVVAGNVTQDEVSEFIVDFPSGVDKLSIRSMEDYTKKVELSKDKKYVIEGRKLYEVQPKGSWESIGLTNMKFYDKQNNIYIISDRPQEKDGKVHKQFVKLGAEDKKYGNFKSGESSSISLSSDLDTIVVPLKHCSQLPREERKKCEYYKHNLGTALYMVYEKTTDTIYIWHGGADGKLDMFKRGKTDGDAPIIYLDATKTEGHLIKKNMIKIRDARQRGEKEYKWGTSTYKLDRTHSSQKKDGVECSQVMGEGQCKILFNACDPVMCPPSRCDFNDKYRVDDVIQSGLIGSLLLCLPNIKEGVIMPICLSGVLAALKNIKSILQGYVDCLRESLENDKSLGICDRIRSIFMCQILWKEAMALMGLAGGNLFDAVGGKGGGEYVTGLKGGVENAKKSIDFFTNEYAKSVFAAYKGRSSKELGAVICEKAIYGKGPILGDIVEDITKAQNPPQFTAYIEEQPLYAKTGQESAYKLYYHIYAGSQQTINYKIYVKKGSKTYACKDCSGTLDPEGYVDKSTMFTLEPGYDTICVEINGQQKCNFGRVVSSSFAISQANQYLLEYELSKDIKTEEQCRADPRGYAPQAQVEKTCAPLNPGIGKGANTEAEWKDVGDCGTNKQGAPLGDCWMRLGNLEDTNPETYRNVMTKICGRDEGEICTLGQRCRGRVDKTDVQSHQDVLCCFGECIEDKDYESLKTEDRFEEIVSDPVYEAMYDVALDKCGGEVSADNPFEADINKPSSWGERVKEIEDAEKGSEEYNDFYYFKGMVYLLCNRCDYARDEFNELDGDYFKEACGENEPEKGREKSGIIGEHCTKTCGLETIGKPEDDGEDEDDEKPEDDKKGEIELKQIELLDEQGGVTIKIEDFEQSGTTEYKADLERGGMYKVELSFSKSLDKCTIEVVGEGDDTPESLTTACSTEKSFRFSGDTVEVKFNVGSGDKKLDDHKIIFTNKETTAEPTKVLLCKEEIKGDPYAFCLNKEKERCSDYSYTPDNIIFSYTKTPQESYTSPAQCNPSCKEASKDYCLDMADLGDNYIKKA